MTDEQEQLFNVRLAQCVSEIDAFLKHLSRDGAVVPQALCDAVEAVRELLPKEEVA